MSKLLAKKSSFVDKLIDDLFSIDWNKIDFSGLHDGLCSPEMHVSGGFQDIDGEYVMEHDFGVAAKESNIKVNVDEKCGENILEVSSEYEWSDNNSSKKSSTYFSTTLPKDADEDTIEAKLGKDGKLKITVQKKCEIDVDEEQDEQTIKVTKNKRK